MLVRSIIDTKGKHVINLVSSGIMWSWICCNVCAKFSCYVFTPRKTFIWSSFFFLLCMSMIMPKPYVWSYIWWYDIYRSFIVCCSYYFCSVKSLQQRHHRFPSTTVKIDLILLLLQWVYNLCTGSPWVGRYDKELWTPQVNWMVCS